VGAVADEGCIELSNQGIGVATVQVMRPLLPSAASIMTYLERIDDTRIYTNYGPLWREFRDGLRAWLGGRVGSADLDVVTTSSGTTAIELALRARTHEGGGVCLMPAYTFVASAHAVTNAGLEPFLIDVDPDTLALTPDIVVAALQDLPSKPAAVLVVSAFGAPPDVEAWESFEAKHGVPVVIDAAAAATSLHTISSVPVCLSLHATKVLGIGEGGAILTTDDSLAAILHAMTGFGFEGAARESTIRGGNYRISEYSAAVGLAALDEIDAKEQRLLALARAYVGQLAESPAALQDGVGIAWVSSTFNVRLPSDRVSATLDRMTGSGIEWRRWWGFGTHRHLAFAHLRHAPLSWTDDVAPRVIGIPFHETLTPAEMERVVECLR
jgi:dTDP-4-amino-4,6-dideoxygalactose transaminase